MKLLEILSVSVISALLMLLFNGTELLVRFKVEKGATFYFKQQFLYCKGFKKKKKYHFLY